MCETCSELTMKTPEWPLRSRSGVLIVNFVISHFFCSVSVVDFKQVNVSRHVSLVANAASGWNS